MQPQIAQIKCHKAFNTFFYIFSKLGQIFENAMPSNHRAKIPPEDSRKNRSGIQRCVCFFARKRRRPSRLTLFAALINRLSFFVRTNQLTLLLREYGLALLFGFGACLLPLAMVVICQGRRA